MEYSIVISPAHYDLYVSLDVPVNYALNISDIDPKWFGKSMSFHNLAILVGYVSLQGNHLPQGKTKNT